MVRWKFLEAFLILTASLLCASTSIQADCAAIASQLGRSVLIEEPDASRMFASPYLSAMPELSALLLERSDVDHAFWSEVSRLYQEGGQDLLIEFLDAADKAASIFQIGESGLYLSTIRVIRDAALGQPPTSHPTQEPKDLSYYIEKWEALRPNVLYEASIQQPLYNQTFIRVQFSERALEDLKVESQNDHDRLIAALLRGHAHNSGTGIKHLANYVIHDQNGMRLSVYEIKPAGVSSFRWVAVRRKDGSFYILKRAHKDEMQKSGEIVNFEY